jgi:hypothetical protein
VLGDRIHEVDGGQWVGRLADVRAAHEFIGRVKERIEAIAEASQQTALIRKPLKKRRRK